MPLSAFHDLITEAMPRIAQALQDRRETIIEKWEIRVRETLPAADHLTVTEIRDAIPLVLDHMGKVLAASTPRPVEKFTNAAVLHGRHRFNEQYNIREVVTEYTLLRRIVAEEVNAACDGRMTINETVALDMAIDLALRQSVQTFLEHRQSQLRTDADAEAKFLSFISHDMRGSLNNILLTIQWVENSMEPYSELSEQRNDLKVVRESALETMASMEQLLQAERLRKHFVPVNVESVDIWTLAEDIVRQFKKRAQEKGLTLVHEVPQGANVRTDGGLLKLVIQNLVTNAIKYSATGTVQILAEPMTASSGWTLHVVDQGKGIPNNLVATLFDAYTRAQNESEPGVGLGLYIAAQAARTIQGTLSVKSKVGEGSVFSITVPTLPMQN